MKERKILPSNLVIFRQNDTLFVKERGSPCFLFRLEHAEESYAIDNCRVVIHSYPPAHMNVVEEIWIKD